MEKKIKQRPFYYRQPYIDAVVTLKLLAAHQQLLSNGI